MDHSWMLHAKDNHSSTILRLFLDDTPGSQQLFSNSRRGKQHLQERKRRACKIGKKETNTS
ncbi:MAG: hypothetical protein EOO01_44905 [Chitinophagaceae bacterium]|nr:MAG: hypothetical protein EOO01_44905 [Chitinophagaceae bacterium]